MMRGEKEKIEELLEKIKEVNENADKIIPEKKESPSKEEENSEKEKLLIEILLPIESLQVININGEIVSI